MQNNVQPLVYHTPQAKRLQMVVINFVAIALVSVVAGLTFGYSLSLFACLAIAGILYFSSGQKITLFPDRLVQQIPLGKARVFLFSGGEFSLQAVTGFRAWLMFLKGSGIALCYTPGTTGKKISLALLLPEEDIRQIHQKIQEYRNKPST